MARRRRNREEAIALGVAQVMALMVLAVIFIPQVRQIFLSLLVFVIAPVALIGAIVVGVFLFRRNGRPSSFSSTHFTTAGTTPTRPATIQENKPRTTAQLLEQLRSIDWFQFEKLVALLYRKLGYTVTRRGGANPDGGIDLILEKQGLRSAVQCKQWKTWNVGVRTVREFLGALTDAGIPKGIFITLCGYTGEAKQLAEKHGIEIINERGLAQMLDSTDARFDPETLMILKDTQKYCPKCESEMVLRTATKGLGVGRQFWGCSAYPKCRFTMPAT